MTTVNRDRVENRGRLPPVLAMIVAWLFLSSCVDEESDCTSDNQCPPGFVCATGGGVFVDGGICVREDVASTSSSLDSQLTEKPADSADDE